MKCSFVNIIQSDNTSGVRGFYLIPGTNPVSYRLKEGWVNVQQWDLDGYHIQFIQSLLDERIVFEMRHLGEAEILICCLKTRLEINSFSNPLVKLNPEYAHLYEQTNFQAFCILKESKQKSTLLLITHTLPHLPKQQNHENAPSPPFLMQARMMEMVEKLIHTSYAEPRPFHLEQIHDLVATVRQSVSSNRHYEHFDEINMAGLHAVREWLDKNMDKEYSEAVIVQRAGMNIKKLNKGFVDLFGQTPYHYLRVKRLKMAHEKISETNISLKSIAKNACYRNYANFSSAFKVLFGYSPASLRK
jgi:AraC-like DNA-binding protein